MNAIEIVSRLREHGAELVLDGGRLLVRGNGEPLSDELRWELSAHKTELMVALGAPLDRGVREILPELRPNLPLSLRGLSDNDLLALINWSIIVAWEKTIRQVSSGHAHSVGGLTQ